MSVQTGYTNATRPPRIQERNHLYRSVHGAFRKLEITNELEQRNIYRALTGKTRKRDMSIKELVQVESFLWAQHLERQQPQPRRHVSDDEAQARLD